MGAVTDPTHTLPPALVKITVLFAAPPTRSGRNRFTLLFEGVLTGTVTLKLRVRLG